MTFFQPFCVGDSVGELSMIHKTVFVVWINETSKTSGPRLTRWPQQTSKGSTGQKSRSYFLFQNQKRNHGSFNKSPLTDSQFPSLKTKKYCHNYRRNILINKEGLRDAGQWAQALKSKRLRTTGLDC